MRRALAGLVAAALAASASAQGGDGLLFRASMDRDFRAETAAGEARPNFRAGVTTVADGAIGGAARWADDGYVAWLAAGNMRAARGTVAFWWRAREAVGQAPFVIFRTGFQDHSSWDMAFLRIDWNGHGFDAFVTDANLARVRVTSSFAIPDAKAWHHLAFSWDETRGVTLFVDGKPLARKAQRADLDAGLDQFGFAGRVIAPHQVQSRYNFTRGSDFDELRIYDHAIADSDVGLLAAKQEPKLVPAADAAAQRVAWLHRYGWDRAAPPLLTARVTRVRKIEFGDARDLKQWMWKGVDGIAETTWPGVYNRSRLPGRNDYFTLPDWNTYVEGGRRYVLSVPAGETVNRVELRGAAYGTLAWTGADGRAVTLARRPAGVVRSVDGFTGRQGGTLSFTNVAPETPIQELWAYQVDAGAEPEGSFTLSYTVDARTAPDLAALAPLNQWIAGRWAPDERATVVAMPAGGVRAAVGAGSGVSDARATHAAGAPIVHLLVPASLGDAAPDRPLARAFDYGWQNLHDGLDGIALDLPAMRVQPDAAGLIALNIKVHDPLWPGRDMLDLSVSVRPGEARTLWLDLRDRILPDNSLALTIASAAPDFGPQSLDGAKLRLVFKPRAAALAEHVADRFSQVRDNWGFLVEEHTASKRESLYRRVFADISDLLRVDPENVEARRYWADIDYRPENMPPVTLPPIPAGVPAWAARQVQDLALVRRFVAWWIDERQVPYGDFGGGISDDTDLTQQWPGLALMGVEPDRINASLRALSDAVYTNGMRTDGLGTITTDELHAYEEGLNSDAERLYLNWGEPRSIERLMDTTRALRDRVVLRNPAGHLHFASNWYGGTAIIREGAWEWQKPYSFTVMHGPILLGLYSANPAARGLVTGVVDGWMAHEKDGRFPNEINWRTDAERAGDGGGASTPLQSAWAAWHFTGDEKYLRPVLARAGTSGASVAELNENVWDLLPQGASWRARTQGGEGPLATYLRWQETGDPQWLVPLHVEAIADKINHEWMYTQGHWWSDRVEQPSEWLQRERLGGIALRRNQFWPGNTVSWRFAQAGAAEQVAILLPNATPERFRVLGWNMAAGVQAAQMTTWNVTAGRWSMRTGTSSDGGRTVRWDGPAAEVVLERSASVPVSFAPGTLTVAEFALVTPGEPVEARPDLGIGADDVTVRGGRVSVAVHSLGAKPTGGGELRVLGADGAVLSRVPLPVLAAPLDLRPRVARVGLTLPRGAVAVEVALPGDAAEVTRVNNRVMLGGGR